MSSKFFSRALWCSSRRDKINHDFGRFSTRQKIVRVNYNKAGSLKSQLFTNLCKEMAENYENLLLHTEARWLSRRKALSRAVA